MTQHMQHSFTTLLAAWNDHQEARDAGAPIADLTASRERLDNARLDACLDRAA